MMQQNAVPLPDSAGSKRGDCTHQRLAPKINRKKKYTIALVFVNNRKFGGQK
jgi:hypothetical protein